MLSYCEDFYTRFLFSGVYAAAFECEVEWVVVKGISHYADGSEPETKERKRFASVMAASVVKHILKEPDVLKDWPNYQGMNSHHRETGKINVNYH